MSRPRRYLTLLFLPFILAAIGSLSNGLACWNNNQQMPVFMPKNDCTQLEDRDDDIHSCMDAKTKLKPLGDVFLSDGGIYSVGDMFLDAGNTLMYITPFAWLVLVLAESSEFKKKS